MAIVGAGATLANPGAFIVHADSGAAARRGDHRADVRREWAERVLAEPGYGSRRMPGSSPP